MSLTAKQEKFCLKFVEAGCATTAYKCAYNTGKMKASTINRTAKDVFDNPKITARIAELQKAHSLNHNITVTSLIEELEEARDVAKDNGQPSAMVGATMGKAKLLGLDKPVPEDDEKGIPLNITFNVSEAKNSIKVTKGE